MIVFTDDMQFVNKINKTITTFIYNLNTQTAAIMVTVYALIAHIRLVLLGKK